MVEISDIELFEKAANGELAKDKKEVFVRRLAEDANFKSDFEKYNEIITAIRQQQHYEELMVVLNERFKSKDWAAPAVEIENAASSLKHWIITVLLAIIAVIITFFVARSIYSNGESAEVTSEQPVEVESQSTIEQDVAESNVVDDAVVEESITPTPVDDLAAPPTAFMIASSGYFITQYSTLSDARSLRLRQNDSIEYKVDMVMHDPDLNIAILRLEQSYRTSLPGVPFRLATTQAFANTEVVVVGRHGQLQYEEGTISALESQGSFKLYDLSVNGTPRYPGSPVISKNGNIVSIGVLGEDGNMKYVKSTHIVGLLARSIEEPGMEEYVPAANNRLAGLERPDQMERIAPFVLEVVRFY